MHRRASLAAAALLVPTLAGCSGDAEPPTPAPPTVTVTAPPEPSATTAPSPSPGPASPAPEDPSDGATEGTDDATGGAGGLEGSDQDEPTAQEAPFPADRLPDTAEPAEGSLLSPVDLRFGAHEGYDRLVLDLVGPGEPGWLAEYVEDPTQQASGGPVHLEGDAYLRVLVEGVVYPTEQGAQPFHGPRSFTPAGGVVRDVRVGSLFEGQQEIFVGLESAQPFRVFRLADPTRVVIDVHHP